MQAVNCANHDRNLSNLRMFETLLITSFNVAQKKIKRRSDKMGQTETGATGKRKIQFKYIWACEKFNGSMRENSPSVTNSHKRTPKAHLTINNKNNKSKYSVKRYIRQGAPLC